MQKVQNIESSRMKFGNTEYDYISEAELTKAIRDAMIEEGLIICPYGEPTQNTQLIQKEKGFTVLSDVVLKYTIADIDAETWREGTDYIIVGGAGQGMDVGDKALSKAMTAAFKVMQRQTFMIPSPGRLDPDTTASDSFHKTANQKSSSSIAPDDFKLTWGKFEGKTLKQLAEGTTDEKSYLVWLAKDGTKVNDDVKQAAKSLIA